jgi:hypothetical protein
MGALKFFWMTKKHFKFFSVTKNNWFGFGCEDFDNEAFTFE